jgi:hypothetical protein
VVIGTISPPCGYDQSASPTRETGVSNGFGEGQVGMDLLVGATGAQLL